MVTDFVYMSLNLLTFRIISLPKKTQNKDEDMIACISKISTEINITSLW